MRISDWSSDVCSSDLAEQSGGWRHAPTLYDQRHEHDEERDIEEQLRVLQPGQPRVGCQHDRDRTAQADPRDVQLLAPAEPERQQAREHGDRPRDQYQRSEEHTSELQSLMRNSY